MNTAAGSERGVAEKPGFASAPDAGAVSVQVRLSDVYSCRRQWPLWMAFSRSVARTNNNGRGGTPPSERSLSN